MSWAGRMVERTVNAMRMGELEGEVSGLYKAIDSWRRHAAKLEAKVIEYRTEALSGWAYWRAAKEYIKDKYGEDIAEIKEIDDLSSKHFKDSELRNLIDNAVEQRANK